MWVGIRQWFRNCTLWRLGVHVLWINKITQFSCYILAHWTRHFSYFLQGNLLRCSTMKMRFHKDDWTKIGMCDIVIQTPINCIQEIFTGTYHRGVVTSSGNAHQTDRWRNGQNNMGLIYKLSKARKELVGVFGRPLCKIPFLRAHCCWYCLSQHIWMLIIQFI